VTAVIRYDRSAETVLTSCDCGWRDLALSQEAAWRVAEEHERSVHPERFQVRWAAEKREQRKHPGMSG